MCGSGAPGSSHGSGAPLPRVPRYQVPCHAGALPPPAFDAMLPRDWGRPDCSQATHLRGRPAGHARDRLPVRGQQEGRQHERDHRSRGVRNGRGSRRRHAGLPARRGGRLDRRGGSRRAAADGESGLRRPRLRHRRRVARSAGRGRLMGPAAGAAQSDPGHPRQRRPAGRPGLAPAPAFRPPRGRRRMPARSAGWWRRAACAWR